MSGRPRFKLTCMLNGMHSPPVNLKRFNCSESSRGLMKRKDTGKPFQHFDSEKFSSNGSVDVGD